MSHIDNMIARLPAMSAAQISVLQDNARNILREQPENADAQRVLDAIAGITQAGPDSESHLVTGVLSWEKHRPDAPRFHAFHDGAEVGCIFKRANYSNSDKDVYSLVILGQTIPGTFQHVGDARHAGEAAMQRHLTSDLPLGA